MVKINILSPWFWIPFVLTLGIITMIDSCREDKHEPIPIISKPMVVSEPVETPVEVGKDIYVTDNMNDENSAIVDSVTAASFWYVYYNAHIVKTDSRYAGYMVIQLSTPYYDVNEAMHKILPTIAIDDFVGVEFFKRVPLESYQSYLKSITHD